MLPLYLLSTGIGALLLLLAIAVLGDLRSRRISNRLVLTGLGVAALIHAAALVLGSPSLAGSRAWSPLAGMLVGGLLLLPLYLIRACGAADVKLMAMAGAFLGAPSAAIAVLCTFVAGGLLSLVFMFGRGVAVQALSNLHFMALNCMQRVRSGESVRIEPLARTAARLPYGVAIAVGTVAALLARAPLST